MIFIHTVHTHSKSSQILSNLKYLNPGTTTQAELEIIEQSQFKILRILEERNISSYGIYFILPKSAFNSFKNIIPDIEAHLWRKAILIFNFFPESKLLELKILETLDDQSSDN